MKKLRIGVIGCGRISVMHFESVLQLEEAELIACCDIKPERAEESAQRYSIKAYTDYNEMLEKEDLDAVHICLPHYLHTKVACAAFRKGASARLFLVGKAGDDGFFGNAARCLDCP